MSLVGRHCQFAPQGSGSWMSHFLTARPHIHEIESEGPVPPAKERPIAPARLEPRYGRPPTLLREYPPAAPSLEQALSTASLPLVDHVPGCLAANCWRPAYPAIIQDSSMQAVTSCTVSAGRLFSMPTCRTCKLSVTAIRRLGDAQPNHIRTGCGPYPTQRWHDLSQGRTVRPQRSQVRPPPVPVHLL